jgi:HD-GYP domain-containing protein (c-di-GMP phosphodiesterase class II)
MASKDEEGRPVRLLIFDKDGGFASKVKSEHKALKDASPEAFCPRPMFTETVRESQSLISNREYGYAAMFVNPSVGMPQWMAIIRTAQQYRVGMPIFVVYDDQPPKVSATELSKLGVAGLLPKPITYADMIKHIQTDAPADVAAPPPETQAESEEPPPTNIEDYVPIDLSNIAGSLKSMFDVYVKLGSGKFVKLLKSGDVLSTERLAGYREKGVHELYVLKSAHESYLDFCDKLTAELLKDTSVAVEVKAAQVFNQGASVSNFLKDSGFSEKSLESASQYVANTTALVQQLAAGSDVVKSIMNDTLAMEHGVAIATLASLLIKHIGGQNPSVFNAVGITCFLHDAALLGASPAMRDEVMDKMSEEEKSAFLLHPIEGAKIVKKIKGVPPAVEQAVLEHHLRLNKQGFPYDKVVTTPNRLAELIGLCEEFIMVLKKAETDKSINPQQVMMGRIGKEFSEPLVKAFIKAFEVK